MLHVGFWINNDFPTTDYKRIWIGFTEWRHHYGQKDKH